VKKASVHFDSKRPLVSKITAIVWQGAIIIAISFFIGLTVNHIRPNGISISAEWSPASNIREETGKGLEIGLDQAVRLFESGKAVFLDARPAQEYFEGHIKGAKSLPWQSFDEIADKILKDIPLEATIITYCDGEACDLSLYLAKQLYLMGFQNVHYLTNGWTRWLEAGLPYEEGWPHNSIVEREGDKQQ